MAAVGVDVATVGVERGCSQSLPLLVPLVAGICGNGRCRIKREGEVVTYPALVAAAPVAVINPAAGEPVSKQLVYRLLQSVEGRRLHQ